MLTGELKNKVDSLWEVFWTGGLTNPLDVIEQMTYLMFIHDLDTTDNRRAKESAMLGLPYKSRFADKVRIGDREIDGQQLKWSVFHDFDAGRMYSVVQDWVFPFIKNLSGDKDSAYTKYMGDAIFKVPTPLMLSRIVDSMDADTVSADLLKVCKTKKTELLFLALFLRMLKTGGRCACIVPDGVLFGSSTAHKAIRKELVEGNRLEAVISMPSGVFKPYAGVSTGILIFTKTGHGGTDKVWFYDMTADGYSLDDKRTEIKDNDIPDIIARFHLKDAENLPAPTPDGFVPEEEWIPESMRPRTAKSFFVLKDEIVENGYNLSINKYKKTEYKPVEYPSTKEIMADLHELELQISDGMEKLETLLGL